MQTHHFHFANDNITEPNCYTWTHNSDTEISVADQSHLTRLRPSQTQPTVDYFTHTGSTSAEVENPLLLAIEEAASREDREAFGLLVKEVNWQTNQPYELTRVIDLCLSLNMMDLAMELASTGRRIFPSDSRIQLAGKMVSPPQIIGTRRSATTGIAESKQWIAKHSSKYPGKWIAVQDGELLGEAESVKELYTKIGKRNRNPKTIIVKVLT